MKCYFSGNNTIKGEFLCKKSTTLPIKALDLPY